MSEMRFKWVVRGAVQCEEYVRSSARSSEVSVMRSMTTVSRAMWEQSESSLRNSAAREVWGTCEELWCESSVRAEWEQCESSVRAVWEQCESSVKAEWEQVWDDGMKTNVWWQGRVCGGVSLLSEPTTPVVSRGTAGRLSHREMFNDNLYQWEGGHKYVDVNIWGKEEINGQSQF